MAHALSLSLSLSLSVTNAFVVLFFTILLLVFPPNSTTWQPSCVRSGGGVWWTESCISFRIMQYTTTWKGSIFPRQVRVFFCAVKSFVSYSNFFFGFGSVFPATYKAFEHTGALKPHNIRMKAYFRCCFTHSWASVESAVSVLWWVGMNGDPSFTFSRMNG